MLATARPLGGPSPAAAQTVLWVFVAAVLADRAIGGRTPWQPSGSDRGTFWLIQAGQLLALALGLFAPRWRPAANLPAWIWPVGAAVMVLGATLRVWSLGALGRGFSRDVQVTHDQQLVTGGPYRWLRHLEVVPLAVELQRRSRMIRRHPPWSV